MMEYPYYIKRTTLNKMCQHIKARLSRSKMLIDININPITNSKTFYRHERWSDESIPEIIGRGYKRCVGLHDNLLWIGIPQYVKINNGKEFDIHVTDRNGEFIYSQDTPATLNDAMTSDSDKDFIRGMGRAHTLRGMDLQTMAMIAIVGVGAIVGLYWFGVI